MATEDDDTRIREGLKFLSRADIAVIRSSVPLERLEEDPVSSIADLLKVAEFHVDGTLYRGRMTHTQSRYLGSYTASLRQFADAIARILLHMNDRILDALWDLESALLAIPKGTKPKLVNLPIAVPATGTCIYDTGKQASGLTQSFCETGLQGTWTPDKLKPKRSARARGAR